MKIAWESGQVYVKLLLTGKSYYNNKRRYVEAICKCGKVSWSRLDTIKRGENPSCGCTNSERLKTNKPAVTHGLRKHPLYMIFRHIEARCYDKNNYAYKNYGAKGVTICPEWRNKFLVFFDWAIKNGWRKGLELDKDYLYSKKFGTKTGLIYSPEYCSFITRKDNCRKRTTSRILEYNGIRQTSAEWA